MFEPGRNGSPAKSEMPFLTLHPAMQKNRCRMGNLLPQIKSLKQEMYRSHSVYYALLKYAKPICTCCKEVLLHTIKVVVGGRRT